MLYITEQAALKLANVGDAAEFEQLVSDNRIRLPFWASVEVWRRASKPRAEQPGLDETMIRDLLPHRHSSPATTSIASS